MTRCFRFFCVVSIAIASLSMSSLAQDTVLTVSTFGKLDSLQSKILSQTRMIQVFLPSEYKERANDKYDVLYVLDGGNWNTGLVNRIQQFVQGEGYMPATIVVSIMGIDRNVELTPTKVASWQAPTGGADKFLAFIKNELIPYVNSKYPSNGVNTLWGHSLSGMFAIYALLNEPDAFTSYIAVEPSLWWDSLYVPRMAANKLPALKEKDKTVFIGAREGRPFHEFGIDSMQTVLRRVGHKTINWKVVAYPDESHSSLRLKSTYDAIRHVYEGYTRAIAFHPMNGMVIKDQPYKLWYFDDTARVYYTLNGSVPTESSANAKSEISVSGPTIVTYKKFTNRSQYNRMASGQFTEADSLRPATKPKSVIPGGWTFNYYELDGDDSLDLRVMAPSKVGLFNMDFKASSILRKKKYALVIDGYLEVKIDGYHVFLLRAEKGTKLYLSGKLLIDWAADFEGDYYSYLVPLAKGFYPVRIKHFGNDEGLKLQLYYLTPTSMASRNPQPIPADVQYRDTR